MNLNPEIRCDYIVTEKRKAIWACQLEMLKKIIEVCKKHDIQFFAVAGNELRNEKNRIWKNASLPTEINEKILFRLKKLYMKLK